MPRPRKPVPVSPDLAPFALPGLSSWEACLDLVRYSALTLGELKLLESAVVGDRVAVQAISPPPHKYSTPASWLATRLADWRGEPHTFAGAKVAPPRLRHHGTGAVRAGIPVTDALIERRNWISEAYGLPEHPDEEGLTRKMHAFDRLAGFLSYGRGAL